MATAAFSGVLWHLKRQAFHADGDGHTDGELLDRFSTDRDEAAFATLVYRHGPMVFGVCRRTLRNEADAEDAFQATFLILARKAHTVRPAGRVGHWLYGVAYNTARKARVITGRRLAREQRAGEARLSRETGHMACAAFEALDQELSRLPEKFRAAVVLCDLEGQPLKEAAKRLECPQGTVASRLARAREMFKQALGHRGIVAATLFVPGIATAVVPARLTMLATRAATGATSVTTPVLALTQGVIHAMFLSKLKFALAAVVATGVLVAGLGNVSTLLRADQEKPAKPGNEPKTEKPTKPGAEPEKPAKPGEKSEKPAKPGEKPAKPEGVKGQAISGTLKSVDADKGTITVSMPAKGGGTREEVVTLDKEVKVYLDGKDAKLGDLKTGLPVGVKFNPDRSLAIGVSVEGPTLSGELKTVDAAKHSLVLKITTYPDKTDKTKTGSEEKTLKVADNARVAIEGNKNATLADLKEGTTVSVRTAADGGQVLTISPVVKKGPALSGELKEVAADGKSLKLTVVVFAIKGDKNSAKTEEKTIKLADDVKVMVDGKKQSALSELKAGSTVAIEMSLDGDKAVAIKSQSKGGDKKPEKPAKP